ncbi:MAG: hypothetical protein GF416_06545 [Candidatus Altiarchaeales archaeon]|nr:hypothetical protein [Candidatus Altiarchaeales archaeon]MBD3416774.1 hypothetical protein [Candidatus Altiarchaeales archaeon]
MLEYVLLALIGCLLGVVTGLTPGLHVNTVCLIGLGMYSSMGLDAIGFGTAMVAMSLTHTFLDFIPSIFLGVPEEETALSVLPAHKLVLKGRAMDAVKLTAYGSILGLVFGLAMLVPALYIIPIVYNSIRGFVIYIVMAAAAYLILRERKTRGKIWAVIIMAMSGVLGVIALNMDSISSTYVLFPVFAGLFGLSGLIYSIKNEPQTIPQQEHSRAKIDRNILGSGLLGAIGGAVVGVLPAMSPSQVGVIMSSIFGTNTQNFLVSVSAINTSDAIYSLVSLYTIQNPRSGVAVMLDRIIELDMNTLILFTGVFALSGSIATVMHIAIGRRAARGFNVLNYRLLSSAVLVFVLALVYTFTGIMGLLVAMASTAIGLLPILAGVSRTHLMGVLIVPTAMYFLGI